MIKKFEEFINESVDNYFTLYIRLNEKDPKLKENIKRIVETGEENNKIVLTSENTEFSDSVWFYEAFLYPFFDEGEGERYIEEISNYMNIYEYHIMPTTDRSPLARKYFLK